MIFIHLVSTRLLKAFFNESICVFFYNELYAFSFTELIFMDFTAMGITVKMLQVCILCQLLCHPLLFLKQLEPLRRVSLNISVS